MIPGFYFLSGFGFAIFLIYGFAQLYELVRHHSMLEYQTPEIVTGWCFFTVLGFVLWVVGTYFGGIP